MREATTTMSDEAAPNGDTAPNDGASSAVELTSFALDLQCLRDALALCKHVVPTRPRSYTPILGAVLFEFPDSSPESSRVTLRATDLDTHLTMELRITGEPPSRRIGFAVDHGKLVKLLSKPAKRKSSVPGVVQFRLTINSGGALRVRIESEGAVLEDSASAANDFPTYPNFRATRTAHYRDPKTFLSALRFALSFAGDDDSRPFMYGVLLDHNCVLATDGHTGARGAVQGGFPPLKPEDRRVLEREGAKILAALLLHRRGPDAIEPVAIEIGVVNETTLTDKAAPSNRFRCGPIPLGAVSRVELIGTQLDAQFPPLEDLLATVAPTKASLVLTVRVAPLLEAIRTVATRIETRTRNGTIPTPSVDLVNLHGERGPHLEVASPLGTAIQQTIPIETSTRRGRFQLVRVETRYDASARKDVTTRSDPEPVDRDRYAARYLARALEGAETATLSWVDSADDTPNPLRIERDDGHVAIVMSIR